MNKITTQITKNTIATDAFCRMGIHACCLMQQGASLRLLSALLCSPNYATVYKLIIGKNKDIRKGNQRRPPHDEQERLKRWERDHPGLVKAMGERGITPRRWCCYYDLVIPGDFADITALLDPERYEGDYDRPVKSFLQEDFPSAFGLHPQEYRPAEVDPDLYFNYAQAYPGGKVRHIFWQDELDIKVINRSDFLAHSIFKQRLRQEVSDKRMIRLLDSGLNEENVMTALAWLPKDKSKSRTPWKGENQGAGHVAMRSAEERHLLGLAERKKEHRT